MRSTWALRWISVAVLRIGFVGLSAGACGGASTADRLRHAEEKMEEEKTWQKLLAKGKAYHRIGDLTRAIQYFEAALEQGAPPGDVVPSLMRAYVDSKQYRLAIQFGEDYLRRDPADYRLRYLLATLLVAVGDSTRAIPHFEAVLRERSDFADAHYALAVVYRDHSLDPVKADAHFRRYLELEPEGDHAREARASLLETVQ